MRRRNDAEWVINHIRRDVTWARLLCVTSSCQSWRVKHSIRYNEGKVIRSEERQAGEEAWWVGGCFVAGAVCAPPTLCWIWQERALPQLVTFALVPLAQSASLTALLLCLLKQRQQRTECGSKNVLLMLFGFDHVCAITTPATKEALLTSFVSWCRCKNIHSQTNCSTCI